MESYKKKQLEYRNWELRKRIAKTTDKFIDFNMVEKLIEELYDWYYFLEQDWEANLETVVTSSPDHFSEFLTLRRSEGYIYKNKKVYASDRLKSIDATIKPIHAHFKNGTFKAIEIPDFDIDCQNQIILFRISETKFLDTDEEVKEDKIYIVIYVPKEV